MHTFRQKIEGARAILLVNPRGLGDVIHSLPAAAMLKRTFPQARIDLLASSHSESIAALLPYVDSVFSLPFYPRPKNRLARYARRIAMAWTIRQRRYDAIINLQALDSTAAAISVSGARCKLGIRNLAWRVSMAWLYSDVDNGRWRNQSAYRFILDALARAGFDTQDLRIGPELIDLRAQHLPAGLRPPFFHFSPFASVISRQLPVEESRAIISGLLQNHPRHQLVISCSAAPRERALLAEIVPASLASRIHVYAGTLDLSQLALVMARADAHIGPDTGSLHLAWLAGARTVSWYLNHESMMAWVPYGPQHRVLLSLREQARIGDGQDDRDAVPIQNIKAIHVITAVDELLAAPLPPPMDWPRSDCVEFRCVLPGVPSPPAFEPVFAQRQAS